MNYSWTRMEIKSLPDLCNLTLFILNLDNTELKELTGKKAVP